MESVDRFEHVLKHMAGLDDGIADGLFGFLIPSPAATTGAASEGDEPALAASARDLLERHPIDEA